MTDSKPLAKRGRSVLFFGLCLLCLTPLAGLPAGVTAWTAPTALVAETLLALTIGNPYADGSKGVAKWLLQGSVVLLGFSMDSKMTGFLSPFAKPKGDKCD